MLLKVISGKAGYCFVNTQIRNRVDMGEIMRIYSEEAKKLIYPKIKLLGLDLENDIVNCEADDGVRVWCTIKNSNDKLRAMGIMNGDKLLVFQSLRYSKQSLEDEISSVFDSYTLHDIGSTFIGVLLKS